MRTLAMALHAARDRIPTAVRDGPLNGELNAYCIAVGMEPDEIVLVLRYGDTPAVRAAAAMAFRLASGGINLIAE